MRKHGVKAYLTKCMTLLFDSYKGERNGEYITDVNKIGWIPALSNSFISSNDLEGYTELTHEIKTLHSFDVDYRLKYAQNLLDKYRKARFVVTSRLHCALPCRAFGTHVHFVHSNYENDNRFKGLEEELKGSDGTINLSSLNPEIDNKKLELTKQNILNNLSMKLRNLGITPT